MTENEFTNWAFLSYSGQDNCEQRAAAPVDRCLCWGDWLHDALKDFSIPSEFVSQPNARGETIPKRIEPIFRYPSETGDNATLSENVRLALEQSKCLIVICSPRSAKDLQVNEAVRHFKQLGRGSRILPIVIAGEPNASEGNKLGKSVDDECFVPALRHPVKPDGMLDTTRRDREPIFADARIGDDKKEIGAADLSDAATELAIARIQLIAGVVGVGFNGLWAREQKRRFKSAPVQRETRSPVAEVQKPDPEAQNKIQEALEQARAAQQQVQELRNQAQEAQSKLLEAQQQTREALGQVAEARSQAQTAEEKFIGAQNQAREAQQQLDAAREQVREAQTKFLEVQNLPQEAKGQIQEAQEQARVAQSQVAEARNESRETQTKLTEAQNQLRAEQSKLAEVENQIRAAQTRVQELDDQVRQTQSQLEEARNQARLAEAKVLEAQNQAREFQQQVEEARAEVRAAQEKISAIQNQNRDAQNDVQLAKNQSQEAQNRIRESQAEVQELKDKTQAARRLTKVFAVMAVLALMAAGAASWQRKMVAQAVMNPQVTTNQVAEVAMSQEQILAPLQTNAGAGQGDNLWLDNWRKTNSAVAFDWSCQLTNVDFRHRALVAVLPFLDVESFTNTLARLNALNPSPRQSVYEILFQRWSAQAPAQALEQRTLIPGQDADAKMLSVILTDWAARDWDAASAACRQLAVGATKDQVWAQLVSQRISSAPALAADMVTNIPAGEFRQNAFAELCKSWSASDAPAALAWAQTLPEETERSTATNQVAIGWAQKDPAAVATFAGEHAELSPVVYEEISRAWYARDFSAATNWVATLPASEKREAASAALNDAWAKNDPKSLAAYALGLTAGAEQSAVIKVLLANWSGANPEAAANWLLTFPETNRQPEAVVAVIKTWSQSEPAAVSNWLAKLPTETFSDDLVGAFLDGAVVKYPEYAAQWTQSVTDEAKRQKYQSQVAREWMATDSAAAEKWIDALAVPEELKASLKTR